MDVWMIVLVTLIVVAVIFGGNVLLRRHYTKKIVIAMSQEDYDGFFKVLDSSGCKLILRPSEREMMRLSAARSPALNSSSLSKKAFMASSFIFPPLSFINCACERGAVNSSRLSSARF